ncbi:MAG TPA: tetratricopeptide repeat-containing glycosyltransferase family protein [Burkholderiales bacterium]|nr:tetratricopeptide repeat-containing glycosyltransferase family protein [Burkholderiales bacterium]
MLDWIKNALSLRFRRASAADRASRTRLDGWMHAAIGCRQAGDDTQAQELCRRILDEAPDHADALYLLGEIAAEHSDHDEAIGLIRRSISIASDRPQFHYALGCVLGASGDWRGAMESYRSALALSSSHAGAHLNLGCILQARGEIDAAEDFLRDHATRELDEALMHFRAVADIAPGHPDGWINLGYAMARRGNLENALLYYERALAIDAGLAQAQFSRSMVLLAQGQFSAGWDAYEWRWQASGFPKPEFRQPEWDGSAVDRKTVFLYTEQGFGDAIQFARYATLVAARGAQVILRCPPELTRLLGTVPGVTRTLASQDPMPDFDFHCPLLSLPRVLRTTVDTIPAAVPYLRAEPEKKDEWRKLLDDGASGIKIGLVWASQSQFPGAELKSMALESLGPLRRLAGATFYSIQMGAAGRQAATPGAPIAVHDLTGRIRDFTDTAALIDNLDLTLSVDTAVAHLAGAMGKPVWTILPYAADWRWEPRAAPGKWYPTMRLYRQTNRGDWVSVLSQVANDLQQHFHLRLLP